MFLSRHSDKTRAQMICQQKTLHSHKRKATTLQSIVCDMYLLVIPKGRQDSSPKIWKIRKQKQWAPLKLEKF